MVDCLFGDLRRRYLSLLDFVLVRPVVECFLQRALEDLWTSVLIPISRRRRTRYLHNAMGVGMVVDGASFSWRPNQDEL